MLRIGLDILSTTPVPLGFDSSTRTYMLTYCNRHYGFYEKDLGCLYCVPCSSTSSSSSSSRAPLPQSGEIFYVDSLQELTKLAIIYDRKVYLNAWTWDKLLTTRGSGWINTLPDARFPGSIGSATFGAYFFIHPGLHNREVRVGEEV